jgi:multidrug efflux pump subunit AcrB
MNLTDYTMKNKVVSWVVTLLIVAGGILSFNGLGRLEDPEFTIKEAVIVTTYPGASAQEVEEEVTLPVESALQELAYVKDITSISSAGMSQVTVEMKNMYRKQALRQIWDEMRRKINDMKGKLPPGAGTPIINDDFSDVYGVFLAVTGSDYSYEDIADYTDFLRRELVTLPGVGKVTVGGRLQEQVVIEVDRAKLTALGFSLSSLQQLLQAQNLVSDGGRMRVGDEYMRISATGTYSSVDQLRGLLLGQANGKIVYLGDVATLTRSYVDPPSHIYRFNGTKALTLSVSFSSGVNVVDVGDAIHARLAELEYARPIGIELNSIYNQPAQVDKSVSDFVISLGQAVFIVVVVLLLTMGMRSGILMSAVLLLTILATFIVMNLAAIDLHRISLGALIIALGMLVDNAIVITEGILIGLKQGLTRRQAAKRIVGQTMWPLLGATVISVTAFAPIGLSPDVSGEFAGSLFWVLLISLMISWVMAITLTPFFANLMFKDGTPTSSDAAAQDDPYKGAFFHAFAGFLKLALRVRWLTALVMFSCLIVAGYGFQFVDKAFFPSTSLPVFLVEYWLPEGSDIRAVEEDVAMLEQEILKLDHVQQVTSTIGQGAARFMLTYATERSYPSYSQMIVQMDSFEQVEPMRQKVSQLIAEKAPQGFSKTDRISIGPSNKAKIEARLSGPDPETLRKIASDIEAVFRADPETINVRYDWRNRTKVLRPHFDEAQARRLGISKADIDAAIGMSVSGQQVGIYRDGSTLLPILIRLPEDERSKVSDLKDVQVYSPVLAAYVGIEQVISSIDLQWEDPLIMRRDRKRTVQIWADPNPAGENNSFALFARLRPQVEALELPTGYSLEWGGEYESQTDANKAVFAFVPIGALAMVFITILLFNSLRDTAVIWLTVPLSITGVTMGLLVMQQPFSFMAMLGFLSLSGMLLKNSIVLVEEIKRLQEEDKAEIHTAIVQAAISRLRPVSMAALTTILGLVPLLADVFFAPLAVTIMFGLGVATVLTLIGVPVFYALIYGVRFRKNKAA